MTSRFSLPTLGRTRSNFTEDIDRGLRQGRTSAEVIDFIFPSKKRYRHFKNQGTSLKVMMAHPDFAGSKSSTKWDNIRFMSKWGWTHNIYTHDLYSNVDGISDLVGDVEGIEYEWFHSFEAFVEGPPIPVRYPTTHAAYRNILYPEQGVIVSTANCGPESMIKENLTPHGTDWDPGSFKAPELGHWSDVVYLSWKEATTEEQRANLNKIVQNDIVNMETRNMLAYVLRMNFVGDSPVGRVPMWPEKRIIYSWMEGFNALLYTPNLRGIVWLLIQHQEQLGKRVIRSITVYESRHDGGPYSPTMIVDIGPRP